MTEITDLSPTDSSNTSVTDESLNGAIANMGRMDNTLQAILGMFGRWTSSDTIASAGTTDIGAQAEAYLTVSGTTTITSFGTVRAGTIRFLRFSGILTLTYNATSLILPSAASITTAAGDTAVFVSEGSGNWRCLVYNKANGQAISSPAPSKGLLYGLVLSNNVTDATNDIDISAGEASSDATVTSIITLASALTKRADATWVAGTNQGGRFYTTLIDGWIYLYVIRNPTTGVVDAGFSDNGVTPVGGASYPAGFTEFRYIGPVYRDTGVIRPFIQNGDLFTWVTPVVTTLGTGIGTTSITTTVSAPPARKAIAHLFGNFSSPTTGQALYVRATSQTDVAPSSSNATVITQVAGAPIYWGKSVEVDATGFIAARSSAAACTITVITGGFTDTRNRNG